ncbi:ATPase, partial [Paenibacillus sp. MCAF20]
YDSLQQQVTASKEDWPKLKNEPIRDTCRTCKQPLLGEALTSATADKEQRMADYQARHKSLQERRDEAKAALAEAKWIDVAEQKETSIQAEAIWESLYDKLRAAKERERLTGEVADAEIAESAILHNLRDSIFILDSIKAYRAKEAELQAAEIQSKFTTLSIRLFKYVASRDEYDPDFSVQKDGKDFISLSVGEKIEAGLELTEVLHKQSGLVAPIFIDGIGEYTGPVQAFDQVITGCAVPNQDLKIEVDGVLA